MIWKYRWYSFLPPYHVRIVDEFRASQLRAEGHGRGLASPFHIQIWVPSPMYDFKMTSPAVYRHLKLETLSRYLTDSWSSCWLPSVQLYVVFLFFPFLIIFFFFFGVGRLEDCAGRLIHASLWWKGRRSVQWPLEHSEQKRSIEVVYKTLCRFSIDCYVVKSPKLVQWIHHELELRTRVITLVYNQPISKNMKKLR